MTTESVTATSKTAARVAPSVLAGIGAFAAVGVYVLISSVGLGLWTSLGPGPGLFPFAMGAVLAAMSGSSRNSAAPAKRQKALTAHW